MRWYKVCSVLLVATAVLAENLSEIEKRGAETYVTASPKTAYATVTAAPQYITASTGAPVYATKIQSQPQYVSAGKYNFASAQPVNFEHVAVQQQPKYVFQQAYPSQGNKFAGGQIAYLGPQQQQASYAYEAQQPEVKYAFAPQPGVKYMFNQPDQVKYAYAQPAVTKYVSAAPVQAPVQAQQFTKVAYAAQPNVAYAGQPEVAHQQQQPHYSPAGSVSSFSFSSPHVTYSNLGLLSQTVGKAYTSQQAAVPHAAAPQVQYAAAPAHYISAGAQQVAYNAAAPQVPQYTNAPAQVQYVSAPQTQYAAAPQLQLASHQGSHSSPQYVYAQPQVNYAAAPKGHYAQPGITYA